MYYPPQPIHWRLAALAVALTVGVAGSFALGQALGHRAAPTVAARHVVAPRSGGSATGALSTAPALPTAAPARAQPLSATSPNVQPQEVKQPAKGHGKEHRPGGGGDHHHGDGGGHGGGGD